MPNSNPYEVGRSGTEDQPRSSIFQGEMRTSFHPRAGPGFQSWRGRGRGYFGAWGARPPVPIVPTRPRPPTPLGHSTNEHGNINDSGTSMSFSDSGNLQQASSMNPSTVPWRPTRPQPVVPGHVASHSLTFPKDSVRFSNREGGLSSREAESRSDFRKAAVAARSKPMQAEGTSFSGDRRSKFSGDASRSATEHPVVSSERTVILTQSTDRNGTFSKSHSNPASRISFKPKIVINSERLQRKQRTPPSVKADGIFSPPSKRRKDSLLEPKIVEAVTRKESHDEPILITSADDCQSGVFFEPMNDVCRRNPGKSESEIIASRRMWRKELAKRLLVQGKIIEKVIYRGDGMAIHWRQSPLGHHASSSSSGPLDRNSSSRRQAPEGERDNDKAEKDDPAFPIKREASAEPEFGDVLPHTGHTALPKTGSPTLSCATVDNSELATTRSCLNSPVQKLLRSRNDIIGLVERTAYRLIPLPFHLISVSKGGDIEFTSRKAPRSPIPEWEILASPGNRFCATDRWRDENSTFVYFAYSSPLHPIAYLGMQPGEEGKQAPKLSYFRMNPHYPAEVDCLCALPTSSSHARFITSGSDGRCYYWNSDSLQSEPRIQELNTSHMPPLNDLVFCSDTSSLYLCGNSGSLRRFDLTSATNITTLSMQATVRQLHIHSAHVLLLDTDDPDLQFEIHDLRAPRSSCRFGYNRRHHPSFNARGDLQDGLFVRGDATGMVRLWDLRNVDNHFSCSIARGHQVPHVIFDNIEPDRLRLVSCLGDNRLSFSTLVPPS